jgi:MFS family permease
VFFLFLLLPPEQFASWGWRVPFLLGVVCMLVGYVIRRRVEEPPASEQARADGTAGASSPGGVFAALRRHPRSFFIVVGSRMGENGFAYLLPDRRINRAREARRGGMTSPGQPDPTSLTGC